MAKKKKFKGIAHSFLASMTIEEGLDLIKDASRDSPPLYIHGYRVKRASDYERFKVLSQGPLKCFECGIEATHFLIEKHKNESAYHINAYAGNILMTWDHIVPKSLGGSNHVHNGRVACEVCNGRRGNEMTIHELLWTMRQDPNIVYKHRAPLSSVLLPSIKRFTSMVRQQMVANGALARP